MSLSAAEKRAIAKRAHARGASKAINKTLNLICGKLELERRSGQEVPNSGEPSDRREQIVQFVADVMDEFEERADGVWDTVDETIDDLEGKVDELSMSMQDFIEDYPTSEELTEMVKKTFLYGAKLGLTEYLQLGQGVDAKTGDELLEAWNSTLQSHVPTFDDMHQPD